ncbi:MAG: hypothetical protein A3C62_02140 [Candidatus Zambryskibacteria bacterium RIFCSPHIGHO2_02_FULL_39_16]|nr:MAG: hypothetical protein A3C62_02140 [Candidatus Zambryskibacteria bacterium RIFCSPHIGHO2_02_FULL_39_16]
MSKKLRTLSGKNIVGFLQKQGFEIEYGKGSHCKLVRLFKREKQAIVVPLHKELARGTIKAIFNQASRFVSQDELKKYFYSD